MAELTEDQQKHIQGMLSSIDDRIDNQLNQLEHGEVVEHRVPTLYRNIAMKYQKLGVCHAYDGDILAAQEQFSEAAQTYQQAASAAEELPPYATFYRRIPMTLTEALYAAALAGEVDTVTKVATAVDTLDPEEGAGEVAEEIVFKRDKYYLAHSLASAVLDDANQATLEELEAINDEKPATEQEYGGGILAIARGIDTDDGILIESGLRSLLEYHDRQRHPDNVIDLVIAPEATALLIITRQQGYDVTIDSEFIPEELVDASVSGD